MKSALGSNYDEGRKLIASEMKKSGYGSSATFLDDYYTGKIKSPLLDDLFNGKKIGSPTVSVSVKKTTAKATTRVAKNSSVTSVGKISTVNSSGIKSKRLSEAIHSAFDDIQSDSRLVVKVDDVLKEVRYAEGNMSKRLIRQNTGAMVDGKIMWVERSAKKYVDKDFITHEIGHKVTKYGDKMTDATAKELLKNWQKSWDIEMLRVCLCMFLIMHQKIQQNYFLKHLWNIIVAKN